MSVLPKHRARRPLLRMKVAASVAAVAAVTGSAVLSVTGEDNSQVAAAPEVPDAKVDVAREEVVAGPISVDRTVEQARRRAAEPLPDLAAMSLVELQRYAVKMQSEFVRASLAYETARTESEQARVEADHALVKAQDAEQVADVAAAEFRTLIVSAYQSGGTSSPGMEMLGGSVEDVDEMMAARADFDQVATIQNAHLEDLIDVRESAQDLTAKAQVLEVDAADAEADAAFLLDDIQVRAAKVAAAANTALAGSGSAEDLFATAEQTARNKAALRSWRAYLSSLDAAKVVPPDAKQLQRPRHLPRGLDPLVGADGKPVPGVAAVKHKSKTLTVLPREAIAAVSAGFSVIGKPYVEGQSGPETYDCSGLSSAVWGKTGFKVPSSQPVEQFKQTRRVPTRDAQVGDLVFFEDDFGVQHVGINLGGSLMLSADATSMQVGVQPFPSKPFAATRVTLGKQIGKPNRASVTETDSWTRCGGESLVSSGMGMVYPLKEGTYRLSATFGESGSMWSSGYHTGLDFAAPTGTPVVAAKGGEVLVESSGWAGPNHVIIDHGDGLQTTYAHMQRTVVKTGDVVKAGALVGAVGSLGNSTGPHLHFEVIVDDVKVDPMLFLAQGGSGRGWGGFSNGMIPESRMCGLSAPGHMLRCDAAVAWESMAKAYRKKFGSPMCITDSYRSYAVQVTTYANKPGLAAVPGTSNHGWALAVDLCGGINSFGTPQFTWMVKNAPRFGWTHPSWARQGGSREEPWHWEFGDLS